MPIQPVDDNLDPFDLGVAEADADGDEVQAAAAIAEEAMTKNWFERIENARRQDSSAYSQLALDRSYARGDSSFQTKVNVIGSYIDTWTSLLYARDPDIDVAPSDQVGTVGLEDARLFAKTLQIILGKTWRKARMKNAAKPWTRAGLTSQVAWLKITWQERAGTDPVTTKAIADLLDNVADVQRKIAELKEGEYDCGPEELQEEQLRLAIQGLQAKVEAKTIKGLCIDPVDMADITVSDEAPSIARYLDSPWISHRTYMRIHQAKAAFPDLSDEDFKKASTFSQKKPVGPRNESGALTEPSAEDANAYQAYSAIQNAGNGGFICVEEVWERDTNNVITLIHGLHKYARKPYSPDPGTTRFYPFFGLMFTEVDGQRWAQSLNQRSQSLQDAFSRAFAAFEEHRSRIKPKVAFQAGMMDSEEAAKLAKGAIGELIAIKTTSPKQDLRQLLVPVTYPAIDMAAYDVAPIMKQFELVWGLQEALTASIDVAKTATEAELQQSGTNARTSDKRDRLEDELTDIAQYTAEIAIQKIDLETARELAGAEAFWPEGITVDELDQIGTVTIRAGSSGKPNTKAMREAWSAIMPLIQGLVQQIGALRLSSPLDVADCLEELVTETAARSGENLDPQRFLPQPGEPMQLIDPKTMQYVLAYPAPVQPGQQAPGGAQGGPPTQAAAPTPAPASMGDPAAQSGVPA